MDSPATNYRNTPKPSPIQLSVCRNRDNDMCFKCKEKGHWAINCPGKSPENSRVLPPPVPVFDGEGNRDNDMCFKCKEKGHWAINCPGKSPENSRVLPPPVPVFDGEGNRDNDMCFKCKEKGHWAINCPGKSPENSRVLPPPVPVFDGEGNRDNDMCFKCKEKGHWAINCPGKSPENSRVLPPPVPVFDGEGNRDNDMCFKCKEKGHWAINCPGKSPENSRVLPPPVPVFDGEGNRDNDMCFKCKEKGHWAINCPGKSPENSRVLPPPVPVFDGEGNRDNDMCFKCKEKGHWAINCPGKSPENSRVLPPPVPVFDGEDGLQYSAPYLICWCGLLCALISSNSEKNPNRKYYSCLVMDKSHTFKWEDTVKEDELLSVPKCRCGAGFCRLYTEASGTNAGLKYFACPIKKGQGACTFKKSFNGEVLTGDEQGDERISSLRSTLGDDGDICLENITGDNITGDGICGHEGKGLEVGSISGQLQRVAPVRPAVLRFPKELEESEQELKVALEAAEEASKVLQQKNEEYYVAEAAYKKARVEFHQFAISDE